MFKRLRAYLQLGRAQSIPLELIPALLGTSLALKNCSLWLIAFGVFAVLYHFVGYGMNSLVDYKKGYDKNDPSKAQHPLQSGKISVDEASKFVMITLILSVVYAFTLVGISHNFFANIFIVLMLVNGLFYNYFGKKTVFKFIPISISHTSIFLFSYFTLSPNITFPLVLSSLYFFIMYSFEIGIGGEIKEFHYIEKSNSPKEVNILKELGAKIIGENYFRPYKVKFFCVTILALKLLLIGFLTYILEVTNLQIILIFCLTLALIYSSIKMTRRGKWDRKERVRDVVFVEMETVFILIILLSSLIGTWINWLIPLNFLLAVSFNKITWGTFIRPRS